MEKRVCHYVLRGDPVAWSRAGVAIKSGKLLFFDNQKEIKLRLLVDLERQHEGEKFSNAVGMEVDFIFGVPIARRVKNRPNKDNPWNLAKIDLDNLEKFLLDTLVKSGNIITDDCIVVEMHSRKIYDYTNRGARTELTLKEL